MPWADICVDDRETCPNEWPTLKFQQRACGTQVTHLRTDCGDPYILNTAINRVCFLAKEAYSMKAVYLSAEADITNGDEGEVSMSLLEDDLPYPGMYLGEFVVYQTGELVEAESSSEESSDFIEASEESSSLVLLEDEKIISRFRCYMEVAESISYDGTHARHGISIAEIRLLIRDRCKEDNFLLDSVEFSDTEIAICVHRPVEYWNEQPPPIQTYTPATFPWRYNWADGCIGELLSIAAHNYARNNLTYSAAGLTVGDKDKSDAYAQGAQAYLERYRAWVRQKKRSINMSLFTGSTSLRSFDNAHSSGS